MKFAVVCLLTLILAGTFFFIQNKNTENIVYNTIPFLSQTPTTFLLQKPPIQKIINNEYHVFQTFNNCGPAALSMALSYYGTRTSQQELGQALRPYQNQQGDNDDKSVTLEELTEKSKEYDLIPIHRPNGTIELITRFITYDIPVITRTLLKETEDIGHYRVIKGFDQQTGEVIQDDSLQGKNLRYGYEEFNTLWKQFNYEYLVLIPKEKQEIAKAILGEAENELKAWQKTARNASGLNLSVALYHTGEYQKSVEVFETVESSLPFRTLWYQIEPIQAYFELGNYDRVFELTDKILSNHNRAFSELYIIRGDIYKKQGNTQQAKREYEKAVFYNINLKRAQEALDTILQSPRLEANQPPGLE